MSVPRVAIVVSHPIQHFVPQYVSLASASRWEVRVHFASSIGQNPYFDPYFGRTITWRDLRVNAVPHVFLNHGAPKAITPTLDAPDLESKLSQFDPHAVWVYGYSQRYQRRARAWAVRSRKRLFYISDSEGNHRRSWLRVAAKQIVVREYLRSVDTFLTVGDANETYYRRYGVPATKFVRTSFPIDIDAYRKAWEERRMLREAARSALQAENGDIILLVVGKLVEWKSQSHVIDALGILSRGKRRYLLVVAGTGVDQSTLERKASALERSRVVFAGFVEPAQLPALYAAADIYVHPARVEPHSLAISEAIYMGCPVVLSDRCGSWGPSDDVRPGRNGLVFEWGRVRELAAAIDRLGADGNLRASFGAASHEFAVASQALAHGAGLEAALVLNALL